MSTKTNCKEYRIQHNKAEKCTDSTKQMRYSRIQQNKRRKTQILQNKAVEFTDPTKQNVENIDISKQIAKTYRIQQNKAEKCTDPTKQMRYSRIRQNKRRKTQILQNKAVEFTDPTKQNVKNIDPTK